MSTTEFTEQELNELPKEVLIKLFLGMQENIKELNQSVLNLTEQIKLMNQRKYGRKTETVSADQLALDLEFNEAEAIADPATPEPSLEEAAPKKKRPKGKRAEDIRKVTDHREVPVELSEEELNRRFGENGWKRLPDECITKLEHIPASFEAVTYKIAVYAGKKDGTIVRADKPAELWQNSIATPSLVSSIIVAKYGNGLPLYRLEKTYEENEIFISRTTMANWMMMVSEKYLQYYFEGMKRELMKQKHIHADETPVLVTKDGRETGTKSYMWVYRSLKGRGDPQIVLYDYQMTRSSEHPEKFLADYNGTMITDGYQTYHKLEKDHPMRFTVAGCWVHTKRKFAEYVKAIGKKSARGTLAEKAVNKISKIYHEEHKLEGLPDEEKLKQRQEVIKPLVDDFFKWVKDKAPYVDSASATGKAFTYALNQEKYLRVFLNDPLVPLDNNSAEQAIRPFTIGRKNWVMIDTLRGAEASAVLYSVVETARANKLLGYKYLTWLLTELPKYIHDFDTEIPEHLYPWSEDFPKELFK